MNYSSFTTVLLLDLREYLKWPIGGQSKVLNVWFFYENVDTPINQIPDYPNQFSGPVRVRIIGVLL